MARIGTPGVVTYGMIGQRVVLRRVAGQRDGRPVYSDLLGILVSVGAESVQVRRDDGRLETIPIGHVHRLRPVPPSRAEVFALEEIAARGWPAPQTARLGEWLLRAGEGWTRRANSALVVGDPGLPLTEALVQVQTWYAARKLPGTLAVPLPAMAAADHAAVAAGWSAGGDIEVLVAPVPVGPVHAGRIDPGVRIDPVPSVAWQEVYRARSAPPIGRHIMTAPERVGFASVFDGDRVVAVGRGVMLARWLGVAAVEVRPEYRRRGLATQIMSGLLAWGAEQGAGRCYLQVEDDNAAALALYAGLGFRRHHRYRIRHAPDRPAGGPVEGGG